MFRDDVPCGTRDHASLDPTETIQNQIPDAIQPSLKGQLRPHPRVGGAAGRPGKRLRERHRRFHCEGEGHRGEEGGRQPNGELTFVKGQRPLKAPPRASANLELILRSDGQFDVLVFYPERLLTQLCQSIAPPPPSRGCRRCPGSKGQAQDRQPEDLAAEGLPPAAWSASAHPPHESPGDGCVGRPGQGVASAPARVNTTPRAARERERHRASMTSQ